MRMVEGNADDTWAYKRLYGKDDVEFVTWRWTRSTAGQTNDLSRTILKRDQRFKLCRAVMRWWATGIISLV